MSGLLSMKQGESSPEIVFDRGGESLAGWTCQFELKRFKSDSSSIISRAVTAVGDEWPTFITQSESSSLVVGHHVILGKLYKTSTDEEEQKVIPIHVTGAWL